MEVFISDIITETQKIFHGNLNFGHYLTLLLSLVFLGIGIFRCKRSFFNGIITIITTLFYALCFCITFNNYATFISIFVFLAVAIVLNFLSWTIIAHIRFRACFKWLYGYLLIFIPMVLMPVFDKLFNLTENVVGQFSLLLISLILNFVVPIIENSPENNSTEGPFEGLGPGWGSVFKNWP